MKDSARKTASRDIGFREGLNFGRVVTYFSTASAVDGFDLAIKAVPDDEGHAHANVELIFLQDKGSEGRTDVVAALRMQAYQLRQLHELIQLRLSALAPQGATQKNSKSAA